MNAKVEVLLLLLAWAASLGLFVVLPWIVVRGVVLLLEVDVEHYVASRSPSRDHSEAPTTTSGDDDNLQPVEPEPDDPGSI